jgi:hypothetical protein
VLSWSPCGRNGLTHRSTANASPACGGPAPNLKLAACGFESPRWLTPVCAHLDLSIEGGVMSPCSAHSSLAGCGASGSQADHSTSPESAQACGLSSAVVSPCGRNGLTHRSTAERFTRLRRVCVLLQACGLKLRVASLALTSLRSPRSFDRGWSRIAALRSRSTFRVVGACSGLRPRADAVVVALRAERAHAPFNSDLLSRQQIAVERSVSSFRPQGDHDSICPGPQARAGSAPQERLQSLSFDRDERKLARASEASRSFRPQV